MKKIKEILDSISTALIFILPITMIISISLMIYAFSYDCWNAYRNITMVFWNIFSFLLILHRGTHHSRESLDWRVSKNKGVCLFKRIKESLSRDDLWAILGRLFAYMFAIFSCFMLVLGFKDNSIYISNMPQTQEAPFFFGLYLFIFIIYITYCFIMLFAPITEN